MPRSLVTQASATLAAGEEKIMFVEKPIGFTVCGWIEIKAPIFSPVRTCKIVIGEGIKILFDAGTGPLMSFANFNSAFFDSPVRESVDLAAGTLQVTVKNDTAGPGDVTVLARWEIPFA